MKLFTVVSLNSLTNMIRNRMLKSLSKVILARLELWTFSSSYHFKYVDKGCWEKILFWLIFYYFQQNYYKVVRQLLSPMHILSIFVWKGTCWIQNNFWEILKIWVKTWKTAFWNIIMIWHRKMYSKTVYYQ